jgi:hypothetical protein
MRASCPSPQLSGKILDGTADTRFRPSSLALVQHAVRRSISAFMVIFVPWMGGMNPVRPKLIVTGMDIPSFTESSLFLP